MIFTFLHSGRSEAFTQLVQFGAYWTTLVAVFGIARTLGRGRMTSLFGALVCGLFIEVLMQSTTTQLELVMAAMVGTGTYFLLSFRESRREVHIVLAALAFSL